MLLSWICSSPKENPELIKDIDKLLKREGAFIVSRGGENFKDVFTKTFNRKINNNLYNITEKKYPEKTFLLKDLKINLKRGRIDIIDSFKEIIDIIKEHGFRIRKEKKVIRSLTLEERLEFYRNPLRNIYIGKLPYKERYRLISEAFRLTIKEVGKQKISICRHYVVFEKK